MRGRGWRRGRSWHGLRGQGEGDDGAVAEEIGDGYAEIESRIGRERRRGRRVERGAAGDRLSECEGRGIERAEHHVRAAPADFEAHAARGEVDGLVARRSRPVEAPDAVDRACGGEKGLRG